jgi:hypothetical protein
MTIRRSFVLAALLAATSFTRAHAACPGDVCDCLGTAKQYDVVALQGLKIKRGKIPASGYAYYTPTFISGPVCAPTVLSGGAYYDPHSLDDTTASGSVGTVAKFKSKGYAGYNGYATAIEGDLATGGGGISGEDFVFVAGTTDTTGTHPGVAPCAQVLASLPALNATLGALPATQTLGSQVFRDGSYHAINVTGPGIHVIFMSDLKLSAKTYDGYAQPTELEIVVDPAATSVIINVGRLQIGHSCFVYGDPTKVLINVTGMAAKIGRESSLELPVLAPLASVKVDAFTSLLAPIYGRKVLLKGPETENTGCSPSGAFVDEPLR